MGVQQPCSLLHLHGSGIVLATEPAASACPPNHAVGRGPHLELRFISRCHTTIKAPAAHSTSEVFPHMFKVLEGSTEAIKKDDSPAGLIPGGGKLTFLVCFL